MNFGGTIRLNRTGWIILVVIGFLIMFIHFSRSRYNNEDEIKEDMVNLKSLLISSIQASQLGGKKVIAGSKGELNVVSKGKTLEGVNDPVTDADFASHCEMFNSLVKAFPKIHVRSEEEHIKGDACSSKSKLIPRNPEKDFPVIKTILDQYVHPEDVTVWIDPLDATKEYTEKLHQFVTTMVCVAVKGVPVIGVIHRPFTQQTSWGWIAHVNSPDLQVSKDPTSTKENPAVIVSISHKGNVEELVKKAFGPTTHVLTAAGAGYKVLEVAHGNADVYLHNTHIKKWDICAGNAIIDALGGRMTTLHNTTIDYSFDSDDINRDGLLVAVKNHGYYSKQIENVLPK